MNITKTLKIASIYFLMLCALNLLAAPAYCNASNVAQKQKQTKEKIRQLKILESAEKSKLYKNQRKLE